jgi:hypothetical protein
MARDLPTRSIVMAPSSESWRELCERHAAECLDLAKLSTDPKIRVTLTDFAASWLKLAKQFAVKELPPIEN